MSDTLTSVLKLSLRIATQTARLVAAGAMRGMSLLREALAERRRGHLRPGADAQSTSRPPVRQDTPATRRSSPPEPVPPAAPPAPPTTTPTEEPATPPPHVSEEATLVAEIADAGAEDGAGPELHVAEPWQGYPKMTASDIIARLAGATPEEVAVVQLYETTHKGRKTVLAAAEQRLKAT